MMKIRHWSKLGIILMTIMMIVSFAMSSFITVKAESATVTLLKGQQFNASLKTLAGDTLPQDQTIQSLYLVKDATITGFERASELNSDAATVPLSEDGTVVAWLDQTTVKWYTEETTIYLDRDCSYMFYGLTALQNVKDLKYFDYSKIENVCYMFAEDAAVSQLDLSMFTSASLINMKAMFADMTALSSLNINDVTTDKVTDMSLMFANDTALSVVDLSSFTVSQNAVTVTPADSAAAGTDTSSETNIIDIFKNSGLTKIYVGYNWKADITEDTKYLRVFTTWFDQTLVMAADTELKDITFTYSLTPGMAVEESSTTSKIFTGLVNTNCYITSPTFTNSDLSIKGTPSDSSFAGKKYMTKKVKVLIDSTQFTEPGIYRYLINETTPLEGVDKGLFLLDGNNSRVLDVLAEYKDDETLSVTASVMHKTQVQLLGKTFDVNEKSTSFDNSYLLTTNDLVIRNAISGNQSDTRKVFTYTLNIDGDIPYRDLTVVHVDGTVETIHIDENKHGSLTFTLKGKELITIKDIQKGASYTIMAEKEALKIQGFDIKAMVSNVTASYSVAVSFATDDDETSWIKNSSVNEDVDVTFLNVKNGIVPTGVIVDTAPYTLSVFIGVLGIAVIHGKKKIDQE